MRVAALIAAESVSGPARQLTALAAGIRNHGVDVLVLVTARTRGRPRLADWLESAGVAYDIIRDDGPLDWRMIDRTRAAASNFGATLIQTHGYKATAVGAALRRRDAARPWIGFFHGTTRKGMKDAAWQAVERRLLRGADRVVVVAPPQARLFPGCEGALRVIDNAVVPEPAPVAPVFLPLHERPSIGVIGRLSEEKGVDVFLRACRRLVAAGQPFTAFIAGDGPQRDALHAMVRQFELGSRIRFLGHIEQPAALYPHLDLVVLPSRSEGMPNVLLEALAADVPVVATRVGAVPDVLDDAAAGVLVTPDDDTALAEGIRDALATGRGPAARAARQGIAARYSLDRRIERHLALYRELSAAALAPQA